MGLWNQRQKGEQQPRGPQDRSGSWRSPAREFMSTRKSAQATTKKQISQNFRFQKTLSTGNKLLTVKEKLDSLSSHPLAKALMRGKGWEKCG